MRVAALGAVVTAAEVIAWTWHRPTALWRSLAAGARAAGWRWPLTVAVGATAIALVVWSLPGRRWRPRRRGLVQLAILAALLFGVLTFAWVYTTTPEAASGQRTGPSRSNLAVQSGALVAGLVGAAITLWLNDQRRQRDRDELDQERDRIEAERFARAVELLGHDRAAVRVGAMHALAVPIRAQTVLDVLCAYLRQPFHHPDWDVTPATDLETDGGENPDGPPAAEKQERSELDREREVRRTAQRLITGLLPATGKDSPGPDAAALRVDLTAAELDVIKLSGKVCELRATDAHFHGLADLQGAHLHREASFDGAHFHREALFDGAHFHEVAVFEKAQFYGDAWFEAHFHKSGQFGEAHFGGPAHFNKAQFHSAGFAAADEVHFNHSANFNKAQFQGAVSFSEAQFKGAVSFREAQFQGAVSFDGATVNGRRRVELPQGWRVESPGKPNSRLLPPESAHWT
jgi:hypothetical protein